MSDAEPGAKIRAEVPASLDRCGPSVSIDRVSHETQPLPAPRFMSARARATEPGRVVMSDARLAEIEPELFDGSRSFECHPRCDVAHPAMEMRERIAERMIHGDSRAAMVVSVEPLVVAAFSSELDAVLLLRFPSELALKHGLEAGARLLTVNVYYEIRERPRGGKLLYAVDLRPGPRQLLQWSDFTPTIADFLTDDRARVDARKREIDEAEWSRLTVLADAAVARGGLARARSGKPSRAAFPFRGDAPAAYGLLANDGTVVPVPPPSPLMIAIATVLVCVVLALWLWTQVH